jgi:hypothetical protein
MDFHVKEGKKGLSATKSSEGKPFVQIFIMSRRIKSGYLPQNSEREGYIIFILISGAHVI